MSDKMREAFDAWRSSKGWQRPDDPGEWEAWQAALSQHPAPVAVPEGLRELAGNHAFLFSDAQQLVLKENGDLVAIIKTRIAEHEKAEEARREAEREQIREQERQRLEVEQAAREAAAEPPIEQPIPDAQQKEGRVTPIFAESTEPPAVDDGQRIKLGDINGRLGFNLTADFLRSIGFEPAGRERAAVLYRADDFPRICSALITHIQGVGLRQNAA